ncbi:SGNH/GDSL hydrolase family protein [Pusillimonas noertemannii]|uniref:Lysophospholipase L1-like esterase n=1 Tax=Pusillimonas noertemannii TaxID=305977 RepID=A0A2U1CRY9_9BURK|nr:SGNH/GDSL hydrolase family protein [Pusillimonas noertemannii]NYT67992.1 SGNH/GDSL hydrolase family protein [Pusillimonas noertemannii]PVY68670.1 lysophospholipase L1-like esterase [Pusillimonas noertemannii]TFL11869.1 SGNH/GDSL hydrolase family protein [Pusillimonas noertemannii]
MTTYNTGNPIGSTAVQDLYDNAENLDLLVNDRTKREHEDRLGVSRKTWWGMEQDFQDFLVDSGYQNIGDYAADLEVSARNQVFWKDGELYRAGAALELPYTTTGDWLVEEGLFVPVGDAALRQELSSPEGDGMIGVKQPFTGSVATTQHEVNARTISLLDFGATTDGTDAWPAFSAAISAAGANGVVKVPGKPGDTYSLLTIPTGTAETLNNVLFDIDPGVVIHTPLSIAYMQSNMRVTRTTKFLNGADDSVFYASPQTSAHVQDKLIWPGPSDADRSSLEAIDVFAETRFVKFNHDGGGDSYDVYTPGNADFSSFSNSVPHDGYVYCGLWRARPDEEIRAGFTGYNTSATALFAVVRCASGRYGIYGGYASANFTRFSKTVGGALKTTAVSPETAGLTSYAALLSVVGIRVQNVRRFCVTINGVSVAEFDTDSDIIEAGFGCYDQGSTGTSLKVQDVVKTRYATAVHGVRGLNIAVFGDSITAGGGVQHVYGSWPEQLRKMYDGAAGMRIKTINNFAISGDSSAGQKALCTSANLVGSDIVMVLVGTNDIQGAVPATTTTSNVADMIDTCLNAGKPVIVGLPPMFYPNTFTGTGQNTHGYSIGGPTRQALARLCAVKGVRCVDSMGGLGNVAPLYLSSVSQDGMVFDNIHPTYFGRLTLAQLFGNALLGIFAGERQVIQSRQSLTDAGLQNGATFTTERPSYVVDHMSGTVHLAGRIDIPAGYTTGTIVYTLPEALRPGSTVQFSQPNSTAMSILQIAPDGNVRFFRPPAGADWIGVSCSYSNR